jgi:4'-phosphopantetheinyl transferase
MINAWTRKESFFKALGSGLTSPLKELEVNFVSGSEPSIQKIGWGNDEKENWKMISLDINEEYIGVISVQTRLENPVLTELTFENLQERNLFN